MQHADLLRHGRMTSLEHSTAHLTVDRRALHDCLLPLLSGVFVGFRA